MDAHELTCVCVCACVCVCVCVCVCEGRDAFFMQEIVKLYSVSNKEIIALLGSL